MKTMTLRVLVCAVHNITHTCTTANVQSTNLQSSIIKLCPTVAQHLFTTINHFNRYALSSESLLHRQLLHVCHVILTSIFALIFKHQNHFSSFFSFGVTVNAEAGMTVHSQR